MVQVFHRVGSRDETIVNKALNRCCFARESDRKLHLSRYDFPAFGTSLSPLPVFVLEQENVIINKEEGYGLENLCWRLAVCND